MTETKSQHLRLSAQFNMYLLGGAFAWHSVCLFLTITDYVYHSMLKFHETHYMAHDHCDKCAKIEVLSFELRLVCSINHSDLCHMSYSTKCHVTSLWWPSGDCKTINVDQIVWTTS